MTNDSASRTFTVVGGNVQEEGSIVGFITAATHALFILVVTTLMLGAPARADAAMGDGTQGRQWVPGPSSDAPVSPAQYGVIERMNLYMDARDGVRLAYNLYLPDAPGSFPCLLIMEGYNKDSGSSPGGSASQARDFASRGYAVVQADNRGEGASEGEWYPFSLMQQQDGYDLVEWEATQPWCNGKVGTFGTSYMAIVQFLMAKHLPPHLVAMIPVQGWGDAYNGWMYQGGWRAAVDGPAWGTLEQALQLTPPSDGDLDTYADRVAEQPVLARLVTEWLSHPDFDDYWKERSSLAADHAAMARARIAILFQTGWNDFFVYSELKAYREFASAGGRRKVVVGPWNHGGESNPDVEPYVFQTYRILWFDRWLKGIRNGVDKEPHALLYVPGANRWRFEKEWPIPDARYVKFYLRSSHSGSAVSLNDGSLSTHAPAAEPTDVYAYSPTEIDGSPSQLLAGGERSSTDQRLDETHILTWTTPALGSPTEVTGPITLNFWASSTAPDTDFAVNLVDVAPDGSGRQVTRGRLKATHYPDQASPRPLQLGVVYRLAIEVWPTSWVFDTGHRMRIELASSDVPLMAVNPYPAVNTIYHDAARPSHVVLPIIGTSSLLAGSYDVDSSSIGLGIYPTVPEIEDVYAALPVWPY